jgi:glycosyltransferase involved in cell wall biosynthesis
LLVTEGTYPTSHGGVSVWCDQLVRGIPEHEFVVQAIVATGSEPVLWRQHSNMSRIEFAPLWGPTVARHVRRRDIARFRDSTTLLLDSTFLGGPDQLTAFLAALRGLRELALECRLTPLMRSPALIRSLLARWRENPLPGRVLGSEDRVPPATVADAVRAASLLEHFLRPLGAAVPAADLCHTVSNGLASLIALSAKWENGTPFLMTEHGIYLRERYLEYRENGATFAVRAFIMRFFRLLTAASYLEADLITPGSDYNLRWQLRHGAPPDRVWRVYNGIDPSAFPAGDEPDNPTLSWLGRITPIKDVESLIAAFRIVADRIPRSRLRLFGSAPPGDEPYLARCRALVDRLGLSGRVTFEGRVQASVEAYHAGSVVVLSSTSEGFPYTVIEAMATGRSTVSTDVGGVREAVGDTGLVVPTRDPVSLAEGCIRLLEDPQLRSGMAQAARQRALGLFTLDRFLGIYRGLYPALATRSAGPFLPPSPPGTSDAAQQRELLPA